MSLSLDRLISEGAPTTAADADAYRKQGHWQGRTIHSVLRDVAREHPEREALVGYRSDGQVVRWTYGEFDRQSTHAATVLTELGVRPGDVVAVMLPNWIEYAAIIYGANELGAIYTGIPVAYGKLQAAAILRRSKAKVLVIPRAWRSGDHLELARELKEELPSLETLLVIDDEGAHLCAGERLWREFDDLPPQVFASRSSDEICYLGFTSGTTGEPKGAMHTHDTLLYSAFELAGHVGAQAFGDPMVQLVASPTGHHTGFIWGVVFTVCMAGTGVHVDRWDATWGTQIIRDEGITTFFGAPTFVQDMMRTSLADDPTCPLRCLVVAGSSVPRNLPEQAAKAFGAYLAPAWGMTECSIIVCCSPRESSAVLVTDGSVFAGSEVAVLDAGGAFVSAPDVLGELVVRGPSLFLGYYDREDATQASFVAGGWFRTGDMATVDEHGWVSLRGRSKDVIIRGGENIPVTDIESLLFDHPCILNAAVVGVPDDRLGERTCAVVVLKDGAKLTLPDLADYLIQRGLSKHYLPELLRTVDELPMTQSGKIQKYRVRELASGE
jgi:cyclohexanecarboxylate-CoA ligase